MRVDFKLGVTYVLLVVVLVFFGHYSLLKYKTNNSSGLLAHISAPSSLYGIFEPGNNFEFRVCGSHGIYTVDFGDKLGLFSGRIGDYPDLEVLINGANPGILVAQTNNGVSYAGHPPTCAVLPGEAVLDSLMGDDTLVNHHKAWLKLKKLSDYCHNYPGAEKFGKAVLFYIKIFEETDIPYYAVNPGEVDKLIRWAQNGGTVCKTKANELLADSSFVDQFLSSGQPLPAVFKIKKLLDGPFPIQGGSATNASEKNASLRMWFNIYVNTARCLGFSKFDAEDEFASDFGIYLTQDASLASLKPSDSRMNVFLTLIAKSKDGSTPPPSTPNACHDLFLEMGALVPASNFMNDFNLLWP